MDQKDLAAVQDEAQKPCAQDMGCKPGRLCDPVAFFDVIEECAICGKLL
jgi:hypothetical protein